MKFLLLIAALILGQNIEGGGPIVTPNPVPIHSASYSGPGDVVSGAVAWWGLRAYTASIASGGTTAAVNLSRSSDSHTCDILLVSSGGLGNTANCSNAGDNGTAVATWCNGTTCSATELYDQTGANSCTANTAPCHLVQATAADQPTLTLSCFVSKPCLVGNGSQFLKAGVNLNSLAQPVTLVSEAERTAAGTAPAVSDGTGAYLVGWDSTANTGVVYAGTALDGTASDNAVHALQGVVNNPSCLLIVDGSSAASGSCGTQSLTNAALDMFNWAFGTGTEDIAEGGIWSIAFNSTQYGNMNTNMTNYY